MLHRRSAETVVDSSIARCHAQRPSGTSPQRTCMILYKGRRLKRCGLCAAGRVTSHTLQCNYCHVQQRVQYNAAKLTHLGKLLWLSPGVCRVRRYASVSGSCSSSHPHPQGTLPAQRTDTQDNNSSWVGRTVQHNARKVFRSPFEAKTPATPWLAQETPQAMKRSVTIVLISCKSDSTTDSYHTTVRGCTLLFVLVCPRVLLLRTNWHAGKN